MCWDPTENKPFCQKRLPSTLHQSAPALTKRLGHTPLPFAEIKIHLAQGFLRGCLEFSDSYTWGNFTVLAVGVWAIAQRDSVDAIIMFLIGLLITILLDIINISLFYPRHSSLSDLERFSSGMAIFSLLLKPLSCLFVYQMYRERGGEYIVNLGFLSVGRDRSSYQSIDQHDAPCPYPDLDSKPAPHPF
ncbi:type-1 angiotensin II receptor-associated protein isoform X1 [Gopherus flavomarginatus]|uniref:type-1 angiotensin II receptor-associated protein isoform X1 n=1 Tax=Gopherus flavomarginatus TaxID=286002 RepID=UPI0021CBF996|nr:type-1 angiotensin II receptor-associated protein isoform X1 [Gopherus flavomarginatus]